MSDFNNFGLPDALVAALKRMQITAPTPVQQESIPLSMQGDDILASAQTGSGKTIAYLLPLLSRLIESPKSTALIITPTRELAAQVNTTLKGFLGRDVPFKTALLIGGESMFKQIIQLKQRPQIIVGTPGRIFDHLQRKTLKLSETRFLIIDEADRMLDMGFGIQLEQIADYLPETRQSFMFSATFPHNIEKLTKRYLRDPKRVTIASTNQSAPKITQEVIHTTNNEKFNHLTDQIAKRDGSIIVFVKTKRSADELADELNEIGHDVDAIHGDLPQRKRDSVIRNFRMNKTRILIATDIAARGLDIPHIMHVINYDLPQCPEDYVHRIGRTARAGAEGFALCLIAPSDFMKWKAILKLTNPEEAKKLDRPAGGKPQRNSFGGSRGRNEAKRFVEMRQRKRSGGKRDGEFTPRSDFAPREKSEYSSKGRLEPRGDFASKAKGDFAPRGRGDFAPKGRGEFSAPKGRFGSKGGFGAAKKPWQKSSKHESAV